MHGGNLKRLNTVRGFEYGIPAIRQIFVDQLANTLLIFHEEDGFRPGRGRGDNFFRGGDLRECGNSRQIDFECGAVIGLAVNPDVAAALFYDAVYGGEAEAGAFAGFLGGKERFKDTSLGLGVHAAAGIGDGQHDVRTGFEFDDGVLNGIISVELDTRSFDSQAAAAGHRVPGVDHQIQNNLLDLTGIGFNVAKLRSGQKGELDILVDHAGNHLNHSADHLVEIQHPRLKHLFAAEGQQLGR